MANIPVERKGGIPGWVWALLALLLVILLFALLGPGCGDEVDDDLILEDTTALYTEPAPMTTTPTPYNELDFEGPADLSDVNMLFERGRAGNIVGQRIRFSDVVVSDVAGDSTFYVTNGTERALVVLQGLRESQSGMGCADGRYCIEDGQTIDMVGRVESMDANMGQQWNLRTDAAPNYYINARRIDE